MERGMSFLRYVEMELAIAKGDVPGHYPVNKYGRTTNADSAVETDVWDRANAAHNQPVWLAPTAARLHAIASTNDNDGKTGSPSSTGARTLRIWGLTSWGAAEVSEDITLDGTTGVNTVNSYVAIHRMMVLTTGAAGPNIGTITATAASDATVTAQIEAMAGQTQMVIYSLPSTQKLYVMSFYLSLNRDAPSAVSGNITFWATTDVESQPAVWTIKRTIGLHEDGSSAYQRPAIPPVEVVGPAIIKISVNTNQNDSDVSAGFGAILVDN